MMPREYYTRHYENLPWLLFLCGNIPKCVIQLANFTTAYQFTLDLNLPTPLREHYRNQADRYLVELIDAAETP